MKNKIAELEYDLEQFELRFHRRYILKKCINMLTNAFIVFGGVTAILYSVFVNGSNLIDRLRYMTFDGTIFTTAVCMLFVGVSVYEAVYETELTYRNVFFLRLSSATTEFVIFAVVMFGLLPIVPDKPDIHTYTGIMMHLIIPGLTMLSFILNDAPIGKIERWEPFRGTWYITIYAVAMTFLFGTRILPPEKAPYSFLNFRDHSILFSLACLVGIYVVGYSVSSLMIMLNKYLSWVWFADMPKDLRKRREKFRTKIKLSENKNTSAS